VKEHPEIELKQQFIDMLVSTYLGKVKIPTLNSNEGITTPINTNMENNNISTREHHEKFEPKFMKNQCIRASHKLLNYNQWSTQKSAYQFQHCSYISKHMKGSRS